MADVTRPRRTRAERGQMILVAAFGVAVMLVALALILNTSIYTENIATRGSDISGGKDALQYRTTTETTLAATIQEVNEDKATTNYADYEDPAVQAVQDYQRLSGGHNARSGVVTNVTVKRSGDWEGAHVFQEDPDGNFSNESDIGNWTVATGANGIRDFSMNVTEDSLPDSESSDPLFDTELNEVYHVTFSGETDTYRVFVYNNSSETNKIDVQVKDAGGSTDVCTHEYGTYAGEDRAVINFTNASVEGEHCAALEMWHTVVDEPFDVHYNNTCDTTGVSLLGDVECGSSATDYYVNGSYSFVLNKSVSEVNVENGAPEPNVTSALYSMRVHVVYESKRLYMETDVRAAPGEPDG